VISSTEEVKIAMRQKRAKKLSLEEAAGKLTTIAERHLATLTVEEQEARVAAFARVKFETSRGTRAKSSSKTRTRRPRQLPEFANNRLPKRILILTLQCFSEFAQEGLLALLRGDYRSVACRGVLLGFGLVECRHRPTALVVAPVRGSYATGRET
jgi:hypothetical protein